MGERTQQTNTPGFGEADLSNCEREQIHLAASIQPHGALLVLREQDLVVVQASANAREFLGLSSEPLGNTLSSIAPDLYHGITPILTEPLDVLPAPVHCQIGAGGDVFDGLVHRPLGGGLIIELEHARTDVDLANDAETIVHAMVSADSIRALCDETARLYRSLTGYDRVMIYRFDDEGNGEVLSESKKASLEALLGNRYPASDIPQIARRLYERNRIRVLVDVNYDPVPLRPRISPLTGGDVDMSLCFLRSMSPIHIQYLKNMGVCATMVASILVGGRLWGLVSCHHYEPRFIHFEMRAMCELLAEVLGTRIASLESLVQAQAELSVRRLEQRMIETISRDGDWRAALFDPAKSILKPVGATGAALLMDGEVLTVGDVPSSENLREIGAWLDQKELQNAASNGVFSTSSLVADNAAFASLGGAASGLLATRISNIQGEYLVWFRPEQVRTVTWGGNPFKPMVVGDSPLDLSPRRSFAQWHQVVEGKSEPWTDSVLTTARLIGETVTDVIIQFRSVSMLIAQRQLDVVTRQVKSSDQPVVVAGADGRIVMTSRAFDAMLPTDRPPLVTMDDLANVFVVPLQNLGSLAQRQIWRGEAELLDGQGTIRPVLVRADTVFSSPDRILGFVFVITDVTERYAVLAARRRFQEKIVETTPRTTSRVESKADLLYRNLLSAIVDNAQLAALEISDGVEVSRMPALISAVQSSVDRSAELLRLLLRHSTASSKRPLG